MKRSTFAFAAILAPAALGVMLATGSLTPAASADEGTQLAFAGPGYGMGPGGGMGPAGGSGMGPYWMDADADGQPGMMRGGFGMRRDGVWPGAFRIDANHDGTLTVDEVKSFIEAQHAARGLTDYKVGEVKEADNIIKAQIVDADGDVIRTLTFPTKIDTTMANRRGPGGFGPGMRGGRGGRPMQGQFGPGFGPGAGGPGVGGPGFFQGLEAGLTADGVISTDEIKGLLEHRLAMWNNPNVKVGDVVEKDDKTITAEIVTKDGSLVQSLDFDRKTGRPMWKR